MSRTEKIVTTEEAKLQLEYIEKLKTYVKQQEKILGRKLFATTQTFGCGNVSAVVIC